MRVAKTVTLDLDDLFQIKEKMLKGETPSLSEFVRKAVIKELKR